MVFEEKCRLSLHPYSIISSQQLIKLYKIELKQEALVDNQKKLKQKLNYLKKNHGWLLYYNQNYCFHNKRIILQASRNLAFKLCVYPEKLLNQTKINQLGYDESFCITYHVSYLNPKSITNFVLTFLGKETFSDRYNYDNFVLFHYKDGQKKVQKLHRRYLKQGKSI